MLHCTISETWECSCLNISFLTPLNILVCCLHSQANSWLRTTELASLCSSSSSLSATCRFCLSRHFLAFLKCSRHWHLSLVENVKWRTALCYFPNYIKTLKYSTDQWKCSSKQVGLLAAILPCLLLYWKEKPWFSCRWSHTFYLMLTDGWPIK